jgi:hypothetical protein
MDLTKINKFVDLISTNKHIAWDSKFKLIGQPSSSAFVPGINEVILDLGSNITIIYNKRTTKITCIFINESEYIQSEFYLFKPEKFITGYVKFMCRNIVKLPVKTNCLVIGLCLGNIPNSLVKLYPEIKRIDCVDVNELLCKFYKKYLCASPLIKVYCMGGFKFLKLVQNKHSYSSVFIDIPCSFITKRFIDIIDKITSGLQDRIIQINVIGEDDCKKINENLFSNFRVRKKIIQSNLIYILE